MMTLGDLAREYQKHMELRDSNFNELASKIRRKMEELDMPDPEEIESSVRKGNANENQAVDILGMVHGSGNVEKVRSTYGDDPFGFVDVICVADDAVWFVQVKTNEFAKSDKERYARKLRRRLPDSVNFEVWVRVDYQGWERWAWTNGVFKLAQELPIDKHEAAEKVKRGDRV